MAHKFNREVRALLWLLPVLAVASWLVWEISHPREAYPASHSAPDSVHTTTPPAPDSSRGHSGAGFALASPRYFDPNTVEYHDLVRLGFSRGEALGIVKYRERGKVFEIPEDFAACYQVSEQMYRRLKPYIRIGEKYRLKPFARPNSENAAKSTTATTVAATATGATGATEATEATARTAMAMVTVTAADSARNAPARHRSSRPALVDLNTADSAALIAVRGIGPRTVGAIIDYRTRLGGFSDVEQLREVRGVTEQNYELIIEQIFVDVAAIQKISINFAPAKDLAAHPYIEAGALRKLLKQRQLKGGWRSIEDLETDNIFTGDELARLVPYLDF